MTAEPIEHFLACDQLWWGLRVSFGHPELLQSEDIPERLEEYDVRLDELGGWLMDELVRFGLSHVPPEDIERQMTRLVTSVEDVAGAVATTEALRPYCIFDTECAWIVAMLRAFDDLERGLPGDHAATTYAVIEEEVIELIEWIEAQRDELAQKYATADVVASWRAQTGPFVEEAACAWRDDVRASKATRLPA